MTAHLIVLVLSGCTAAIACGVAILPRKLRDTVEATRPDPAREAAAIAQARAEFLSTPSRLRHLEVEASKAGDLLGAARYAELAEAYRG